MEVLRQKGDISKSKINRAIAMACGMEPTNEMGAMLAVQITASHVGSVRLLGEAAKADFAR
jgi:methenyltetrahydromethanopterin cyclohydrolase